MLLDVLLLVNENFLITSCEKLNLPRSWMPDMHRFWNFFFTLEAMPIGLQLAMEDDARFA